MRGRKPRAVPLKAVKLGTDTIAQLRDIIASRSHWDVRTLDAAVQTALAAYQKVKKLSTESVARSTTSANGSPHSAEIGRPKRSHKATEKRSAPAWSRHACPSCGAQPGFPCSTARGGIAAKPHESR